MISSVVKEKKSTKSASTPITHSHTHFLHLGVPRCCEGLDGDDVPRRECGVWAAAGGGEGLVPVHAVHPHRVAPQPAHTPDWARVRVMNEGKGRREKCEEKEEG